MSGLEAVIAEHYLNGCAEGGCDLNDDRFPAHLAAAALAHIEAVAGDAGVREAVGLAVEVELQDVHSGRKDIGDAAVAAFVGALGDRP